MFRAFRLENFYETLYIAAFNYFFCWKLYYFYVKYFIFYHSNQHHFFLKLNINECKKSYIISKNEGQTKMCITLKTQVIEFKILYVPCINLLLIFNHVRNLVNEHSLSK